MRIPVLAAFALAAWPLAAQQVERQLDEVARIASVMVDGDLAKRIMTPRAAEWLLKKHPKDPWFGADNFDVEHEPYIRTKKTLIRLARLAPFPCDVNLWMPVPADPPRIQVLIRNVNEMSQFWQWGEMHQPLEPEMRKALASGERVLVKRRPGWISVLAPVRDSMDDIVGLVEVVTQQRPDAHENVK